MRHRQVVLSFCFVLVSLSSSSWAADVPISHQQRCDSNAEQLEKFESNNDRGDVRLTWDQLERLVPILEAYPGVSENAHVIAQGIFDGVIPDDATTLVRWCPILPYFAAMRRALDNLTQAPSYIVFAARLRNAVLRNAAHDLAGPTNTATVVMHAILIERLSIAAPLMRLPDVKIAQVLKNRAIRQYEVVTEAQPQDIVISREEIARLVGLRGDMLVFVRDQLAHIYYACIKAHTDPFLQMGCTSTYISVPSSSNPHW